MFNIKESNVFFNEKACPKVSTSDGWQPLSERSEQSGWFSKQDFTGLLSYFVI